MADHVEITDRDSAQAWLKQQDHQTQVWFASRCALRAFPGLGDWEPATKSGSTFRTLRPNLIAAAAATCPAAEMVELIEVATAAAFAANLDATRSAAPYEFAVASSAAAVTTASSFSDFSASTAADAASFYDRFDFTAATYDANNPNLWGRLWHEPEQPAAVSESWRKLKAQRAEEPDIWAFWIEWYERILVGDPLPWALTQRIALELTQDEWEAGPSVVAGRIRAIRLNWRTEVGRRLVFNGKKGQFEPEIPEHVTDDIREFVVRRVSNALASALQVGSTNGFLETSFEAVYLQPVLSQEDTDASLIAATCWDACMSLNRNIGDLYPEDASLIVLKNTLYTAVEELCEGNDVIRGRIARLAALETRKYPSEEDRAEIKKLPQAFAPEMSTKVQEAFESDIEVILGNPKPPRSVRVRVTNWTTTILAWMDKTKKGDARLKWLSDVAQRLSKWWPEAED